MENSTGRSDSVDAAPLSAYIISLLAFLCLIGLFRDNAILNEVTKFSDAMYYANPDWIPNFLPQGPDFGRRQWLFQTLVTPLLNSYGFLAVSLTGRLFCFVLFALGFALIARALRLKPVVICLIVALFYYYPGVVAGEWVLKAFEPKVISYALVLIALGHFLSGHRSLVLIAALLGVATSFHVLVGLYAGFALSVAAFLQRRRLPVSRGAVLLASGVFCCTGILALKPVIGHLLGIGQQLSGEALYSPSYIYVYLRSPHHLDPSSWKPGWIGQLLLYVAGFAGAAFMAHRAGARSEDAPLQFALQGLLLFAVAAMLPFCFGLIIAPFDSQGRFLQYYLFRFGDVMLPLCTFLFIAFVLQSIQVRRLQLALQPALAGLFVGVLFYHLLQCPNQLAQLREYPGSGKKMNVEWLELTAWVKTGTGRDALFVVPPGNSEFITFPWLARRRMLATFKQVNLSGGLIEWQRRLSDLAGTAEPWPYRGFSAARWLRKRYLLLENQQVTALMTKYRAAYFVTFASHVLELPVVFSNRIYTVYTLRESSE